MTASAARPAALATLDGPRWGPRSKGTPRQLVVICHGLGADGHDVIDLAPAWSVALPDALFVAPHGPEPCADNPMGRQWFGVGDRAPATMAAGVRRARVALDGFLDAELARLGLPPEAYALFGFSQGAMTALYTGLRRCHAPRAILAYSGALLAPETLAAEIANRAPVLLVHGEADEVVPAGRSHEAEQTLQGLGVPLETLYGAELGHMLSDAGISFGALFLQRAFAGK
jgi:phospholipase/carboxylesterase